MATIQEFPETDSLPAIQEFPDEPAEKSLANPVEDSDASPETPNPASQSFTINPPPGFNSILEADKASKLYTEGLKSTDFLRATTDPETGITARLNKAAGYVGNVAKAIPADVAETVHGDEKYYELKNLAGAALGEEPEITGKIASASDESPVAATTAKIAQGLAGTAPMLAMAGLPEGAAKLVSLGFSAQMVKSGGDAATTLGTELGKNPEDRNMDKITSAVSDLSQTTLFAPLAAKFGALDTVEGKLRPKDFAMRKLPEQLKNALINLSQPGNIKPASIKLPFAPATEQDAKTGENPPTKIVDESGNAAAITTDKGLDLRDTTPEAPPSVPKPSEPQTPVAEPNAPQIKPQVAKTAIKPAIVVEGKVVEAQPGEHHADIEDRVGTGDKPVQEGFVENGQFKTREQVAEEHPEIPTTVEPGKVHTEDLEKISQPEVESKNAPVVAPQEASGVAPAAATPPEQSLPPAEAAKAKESAAMMKAESDELSALRKKDLSEDGLTKDEEQRLYELTRKESRSNRSAKTLKMAGQLKEQGVEIPDSFLHPSDGVENHITSWTYDHRNGMMQIRVERHTDASMSGRLITAKAGDTLTDGMDDAKVGTTRYREANPDAATRPGEKSQTPPGANPGTSKLSPAVRQSTPQSLEGKNTTQKSGKQLKNAPVAESVATPTSAAKPPAPEQALAAAPAQEGVKEPWQGEVTPKERENFIYNSAQLSPSEFARIHRLLPLGQQLPDYEYRKASDIADKSASILKDKPKWEAAYKKAIMDIGETHIQRRHEGAFGIQIFKKQPVNAEAVDAYKIELPQGYVREGDRYVFKQPTPSVVKPEGKPAIDLEQRHLDRATKLEEQSQAESAKKNFQESFRLDRLANEARRKAAAVRLSKQGITPESTRDKNLPAHSPSSWHYKEYTVEHYDSDYGWGREEDPVGRKSYFQALLDYEADPFDEKRLVLKTRRKEGDSRFGNTKWTSSVEVIKRPSFVEKLLNEFPGMSREDAISINKRRNPENEDPYLVAQAWARHQLTGYDEELSQYSEIGGATPGERAAARAKIKEQVDAQIAKWRGEESPPTPKAETPAIEPVAAKPADLSGPGSPSGKQGPDTGLGWVEGSGGDVYGIAQRVREARAKAGQVELPSNGQGVSAEAAVEWGRDLKRNGADPEKAMQGFEKTKATSFDLISLARAHGEDLAQAARQIESKFGTDSTAYRTAQKALDDWDARSKAIQTEWHKQGVAQQGETDLDTGSFTGISRAFRDVTGEDLPKYLEPRAKGIAKGVSDADKAVEPAKVNLQTAIDNLTETGKPRYSDTIIKIAEKIVSSLDKRADAARARIRARAFTFSANIDPTVLRDVAEIGASHIAHWGLDFAKWSKVMVDEFGDKINPHLKTIFDASQKLVDAEGDKHGPNADAIKSAVKKTKPQIVVDAEKKALESANDVVRKSAADLADAETKARVTEQKLKTASDKVQQKAAQKALESAQKTVRQAAARAADAEIEARIAKAKLNADEWSKSLEAQRLEFRKYESGKPMTPMQVKTLWQRAKTEYIDNGETNMGDTVHKLADDLGIPAKDVLSGLSQTKQVKRIADDVWQKQRQARLLKQAAKRWIEHSQETWLQKALPATAKTMFSMKVGLHGTVALGTHASLEALNHPIIFSENFGKMYHLVVSAEYFEMQKSALARRDNYTVAQRNGLVNDMNKMEDFNDPQLAQGFPKMAAWFKAQLDRAHLGRFQGMGTRGYSVLKILRQDLFDHEWDKLPESMKSDSMAKAISDSVNHMTGVTKAGAGKLGNAASYALFAPKLAASRVAVMVADPVRAAASLVKMDNMTDAERWFAKNQFKEKAKIAAAGFGLLLANQQLNNLFGDKKKLNGVPTFLGGGGWNPMESDFMKFRVAGMNFAWGSPFLTMARLPLRLYQIGSSSGGKTKYLIYPDESMDKTLGSYARTQASPFLSPIISVITKGDYQDRPLPQIPGYGPPPPMPKRLAKQGVKPYTWTEFLSDIVLPIPVEQAMNDTWHSSELSKKPEQDHALTKAFVTGLIMSGTGGRLSDDWGNSGGRSTYAPPVLP